MPNFFNSLTNRQGLIVWGGVASTDCGMVVSRAPAYDKPTRRVEAVKVPGRSGAVLFDEGAFDDTVRTYNVWISEDTAHNETLSDKVSAVSAWLFSKQGYTRLEDNFEPDVFRLAYYSGSNDFTNELLQYGESSLTFTCRPERFLKSGTTAIEVDDGDTLTNPTAFASKPLIYIEASGTVELSINGVTITAEVDDFLYIDCETMNAYRLEAENKNSKISGAFPVIAPGANGIGINVTGTLVGVEITPRYFTI